MRPIDINGLLGIECGGQGEVDSTLEVSNESVGDLYDRISVSSVNVSLELPIAIEGDSVASLGSLASLATANIPSYDPPHGVEEVTASISSGPVADGDWLWGSTSEIDVLETAFNVESTSIGSHGSLQGEDELSSGTAETTTSSESISTSTASCALSSDIEDSSVQMNRTSVTSTNLAAIMMATHAQSKGSYGSR